ncbi:MAG: spermidine/putrescine ABC transporter permease PotC, partial [Alphaproteobacteria bacterium]
MNNKKGFSVTKQYGFKQIALICFFALYAPILLLVFYSFNAGNNLMLWEGFSLRWYITASK